MRKRLQGCGRGAKRVFVPNDRYVEQEEKSVTLLHSFGDRIHNELVLLAPAGGFIPESLTRRHAGPDRHARWLSEVQRLRGRVYLADGAVQASQLTADGRHVQRSDYDRWHLLNGRGSDGVAERLQSRDR